MSSHWCQMPFWKCINSPGLKGPSQRNRVSVLDSSCPGKVGPVSGLSREATLGDSGTCMFLWRGINKDTGDKSWPGGWCSCSIWGLVQNSFLLRRASYIFLKSFNLENLSVLTIQALPCSPHYMMVWHLFTIVYLKIPSVHRDLWCAKRCPSCRQSPLTMTFLSCNIYTLWIFHKWSRLWESYWLKSLFPRSLNSLVFSPFWNF